MGIVGRLTAAGAVAGLAVLTGVALSRRQKLWTVSHSNHGFALALYDAPTWAILAEDALQALPCTHNAPGWAFKVGLRRFGVWKDGTNEPLHSLGSLLIKACDVRCMVVDKVSGEWIRLPLTREQMLDVDADWVAEIDRVMADDEEDKTSGD